MSCRYVWLGYFTDNDISVWNRQNKDSSDLSLYLFLEAKSSYGHWRVKTPTFMNQVSTGPNLMLSAGLWPVAPVNHANYMNQQQQWGYCESSRVDGGFKTSVSERSPSRRSTASTGVQCRAKFAFIIASFINLHWLLLHLTYQRHMLRMREWWRIISADFSTASIKIVCVSCATFCNIR